MMGNVLWGISLLSRYSTEKYGAVAHEETLIELESDDSKISDDVEAVLIMRGVDFVAWRGVGNKREKLLFGILGDGYHKAVGYCIRYLVLDMK
jgi:hypothetical protein